jgi:SAM-dependent methyltransferase
MRNEILNRRRVSAMPPKTNGPRQASKSGDDAQRGDAQQRANDQLWGRKGLVRAYATRELRPVEVILLVRYKAELSRRVVELGCGAGRLTGYLGEIASAAHGIDISPEMVEYCRRTYPKATFSEGDLRDVAKLGRGSYDTVVATYNVLDVLGDVERREVLDGIHEVLPEGGLLIMSSHNLAYAPRLADPLHLRHRSLLGTALTIMHWPRWQRNRRRLLPFQRTEPGYSILNDISHDFSALHYYISRDAQERQLAEQGFELVECLDLEGRQLAAGEDAPDCPELVYVARRRPDGETAAAQ